MAEAIADTNTRPLLSVPQVARYLGVSNRVVWDQISARELPHVRVARRVLIRPESLEEYLRAREVGGVAK